MVLSQTDSIGILHQLIQLISQIMWNIPWHCWYACTRAKVHLSSFSIGIVLTHLLWITKVARLVILLIIKQNVILWIYELPCEYSSNLRHYSLSWTYEWIWRLCYWVSFTYFPSLLKYLTFLWLALVQIEKSSTCPHGLLYGLGSKMENKISKLTQE